jgi:hypothetical protein
MFTAHDIQEKVRRQPFRPLRIVSTSGPTYDIHHPDLIMVGKREVTVGIGAADEPGFYDRQSWIAILHVADIIELPVAAPDGLNGPPKASS